MWTRGLLFSMAFGLAASATPVAAQDYSTYRTPQSQYRDDTEEVVVVAPPYRQEYGPTGAPIVTASLSRPVRFDDLDLRSRWGVRALHSRIQRTAQALCSRINAMYPASVDYTDGAWPVDTHCIRRATVEAMYQAGAAIRAARRGDSR